MSLKQNRKKEYWETTKAPFRKTNDRWDDYGRYRRELIIKQAQSFIHGNLNKPWDEVYSEICKRYPKNGRYYYVHDYLPSKIHNDNLSSYFRWCYIDQEGILRKNNRPKYKRKLKIKVPCVYLEELENTYIKLDGFWYRCKISIIQKKKYWSYLDTLEPIFECHYGLYSLSKEKWMILNHKTVTIEKKLSVNKREMKYLRKFEEQNKENLCE